ncbi:MAG: glutathione S-transferase family protein, partial [Pseudomonadota bacterium]
MKLFNGISPNGARVAIFLAEKGIEIPVQPIDLMAGEARTEAFRKINSLGQVPVLQLDDGRHLAESIAICRYLEQLHPKPALFGGTPVEKAFVEMWIRRMELRLFNTVGDVGLHEFEFFKDHVEQNADYAAAQRRQFFERLKWLEEELADGRPFVTGETFSMADIVGMTMLLIMGYAGIALPADL